MTDIAPTNTSTNASANRTVAYGVDTARRQETSATTSSPSNEVDRDMFLKLLVAQLRYQNPLDPSSPDDFMAQTAQFTMVESLEELSQSSAASNRTQMIATASSLVGKNASYVDSAGKSQTGLVSSARIVDSAIILKIGTVDVPLESVTSIAAAPTNAVTTTTNGGSTSTGTSGATGSNTSTGTSTGSGTNGSNP
jgi:flagellar basal-body rod modification protein FlgD